MRLLRRLWRRAQAVLPASDGPDPAWMAASSDGGNPLHALFDEWRLPWRELRRQVESRVIVRPDPFYRQDALALVDALPLPGAMAPWSASGRSAIPPQFPISRFSALVWFEDDAHANLRRTADYVAKRLGAAPIGRRWNTLVGEWHSGTAEIGLIAWPSEWQSHDLRNDAHEREPRLRTACHVNVATGFRLALSDRERDWVRTSRPLAFDGTVGTARMVRAGASAPLETQLEYARDPDELAPSRQGSLGFSEGAEAFILVSNQLFVVPREDVLRLNVIRLTPAKGGGGSSLHARCRTQAPGADAQHLFLAQASDPDGMNDLARKLGVRLGCPVDIAPYCPDV